MRDGRGAATRDAAAARAAARAGCKLGGEGVLVAREVLVAHSRAQLGLAAVGALGAAARCRLAEVAIGEAIAVQLEAARLLAVAAGGARALGAAAGRLRCGGSRGGGGGRRARKARKACMRRQGAVVLDRSHLVLFAEMSPLSGFAAVHHEDHSHLCGILEE